MTNLNVLGNRAAEFGKYFGKATEDSNKIPIWSFKDMTPDQVRSWNKDFPKFRIDLDNRRMMTPIFVKRWEH